VSSVRGLAILIALTWATLVQATVITVRRDGTGDYATIQPALDAAATGDTILIGPGEYTESTSVRLPGWAYNIQSYAHLRCDNLTIIGAGMDATVIGPATYVPNADGDPAGLSYSVGGGALHISDLGIRHSYAMFVLGIVYMDRCHFTNNKRGLSWSPSGPGGWVRDSVFEVTEPIFDPESFQIGYTGLGSGISLERCRFGDPGVLRDVQGVSVVDCALRGVDLYGNVHVVLQRCTSSGANVGISFLDGGSGLCEIYDCAMSGASAAVVVSNAASGARYVVENSRLEGGNYAVFWSRRGAGSCSFSGCDLLRGSGQVVLCEPNSPVVTHDLRNNYWGTADEATIRSWITDHVDNPQIGATVLYAPFAGQSVPAETTSWGDLKALFR
jgi:hypothetical protein